MGRRRWDRLLRRGGDEEGREEVDRGRDGDDESVHLDRSDAWWTGEGEPDPETTDEVQSHLGPRTADEIRESFKRKRKAPQATAKPHGAFSEYYSADSLFTSVEDGDVDPDLFDPDDPYVVLGVPASATWEQITNAHRRLAKLHHPDRLLHATEEDREKSEARMRELNIAYAELRRRRGTS